MGEAPAPAPPASTPLAAREKPSLRRWLATHKLQACALCFMVMSIALYFLVQAFAAGGALGAALAVGFFCLFCYCCDQGYRVYASEGFWRTYAFLEAATATRSAPTSSRRRRRGTRAAMPGSSGALP